MLKTSGPQSVGEKGKRIYYQLQPILEKKYPAGYVVLIDTDTGKYFVGKNTIEAYKFAKKEYQNDYKGENFFGAHVGQLASAL